MTTRERAAVIAACVAVSFVLADGQDFSWLYRGAEQLLDGANPYKDARYSTDNPYPWDFPLYYPLPAVLLAVPLTVLPYSLAASTFAGASAGVLAYAVTKHRKDWHRLLVFVSACYYVVLITVQWSPLVMAAYFLAPLCLVALCKPSLALAVLPFNKDWRWAFVGVAIVLLSLVILPSWPLDWLHNVSSSERHLPPIIKLLPFSPLLLLAATRWHQPNAKLFLLLLFVPQYFNFYDQVLLWLLPVTWRGSLGLVASSWLGYVFVETTKGSMGHGEALQIASFFALYLPALLVVLLDHVANPSLIPSPSRP
jgi:hypothetical protein